MNKPYIGLDYGHGKANIDHAAGIRYGVINANSISGDALNDFEPFYPDDLTEEDSEFYEVSESTYEKDGYILHFSHDSNIIMVIKSPCTTNCAYCSPCYPGAGDLDTPNNAGIKTYALDSSFFDEFSPMPYTLNR